MTNLIKIELKKFSVKSHVIQLIVANIAILALLTPLFIFVAPEEEYLDLVALVSILNLATFIVWQGVLIAKIIVEEFQSKTIFLLFTYPISRKKLIVSKLVIINTVIFFSILVTQIFQNTALTILSQFVPQLEYSLSIYEIGTVAVISVASVMMGMLSLFVGMIKKSTIATIVSSIVVVAMLGGSVGEGVGLIMQIPVSLSVGVVGVILAYIAIKDIDKKDLLV